MSLSKALPKTLKEVRIHLCQRGPSSAGVRDFLKSSYIGIKQSNPDLKFLIREAEGVNPKAFARFEYGVESQVPLSGSSAEVESQLANLLSKSPADLSQ